jgi:hypothetical protein
MKTQMKQTMLLSLPPVEAVGALHLNPPNLLPLHRTCPKYVVLCKSFNEVDEVILT